jgi:hypothetical protein
LVPPWSRTIVLERANFLVAFAGAVGAGYFVGVMTRRPPSLKVVAAVVGATAVVGGLGFALFQARGLLEAPDHLKLTSLLVGFGGMLAAAALMLASRRLPPSATYGLAGVLVLVSLVSMRDFNVTLPSDQAYPPRPAAIAALERQRPPFRVGVIRDPGQRVLRPDTAALYGLDGVEGYDFPLSERWSELQTRTLGFKSLRPESRTASGPPTRRALEAYRALNTRFFIAAPGTPKPEAAFRTLYNGPDARVFEDPGALPRAYLAPSSRPTRFQQPAPDHVRVLLPRGARGRLVLGNAYQPSWRAEADGREVPVRPASFARMEVTLRGGEKAVDFRLDRTSFWLGAALSLLGASLCAVLVLTGAGRRPRRERRG